MKLFIQIISLFSMLYFVACGTKSADVSDLPSTQEKSVEVDIKLPESIAKYFEVEDESSCAKITYSSEILEVDYSSGILQSYPANPEPKQIFKSKFVPGIDGGSGSCKITWVINLEIGKWYLIELKIMVGEEIALWGNADTGNVTSEMNKIVLYLNKVEKSGTILEFDFGTSDESTIDLEVETVEQPVVTHTECKFEKKFFDYENYYKGGDGSLEFFHTIVDCFVDYTAGDSPITSVDSELLINCNSIETCNIVKPSGTLSTDKNSYGAEFDVNQNNYINSTDNYTLRITIKTEDGKSYLHEASFSNSEGSSTAEVTFAATYEYNKIKFLITIPKGLSWKASESFPLYIRDSNNNFFGGYSDFKTIENNGVVQFEYINPTFGMPAGSYFGDLYLKNPKTDEGISIKSNFVNVPDSSWMDEYFLANAVDTINTIDVTFFDAETKEIVNSLKVNGWYATVFIPEKDKVFRNLASLDCDNSFSNLSESPIVFYPFKGNKFLSSTNKEPRVIYFKIPKHKNGYNFSSNCKVNIENSEGKYVLGEYVEAGDVSLSDEGVEYCEELTVNTGKPVATYTLALLSNGVTDKPDDLIKIKELIETYFIKATKGYFDIKVMDIKIIQKDEVKFEDLTSTYGPEYFGVNRVAYFVTHEQLGKNGKSAGDKGFYVSWDNLYFTTNVSLHEFGHFGFPVSTGDIQGASYPIGAKDGDAYALIDIIPLIQNNNLMSYARDRYKLVGQTYGDDFLKKILHHYWEIGEYLGNEPKSCK